MIEIKAPEPYNARDTKIFLAGSIEMDTAENWQTVVVNSLADKDVTILNPRRDVWDSSWEQSKDNPHFREQVNWELTGLDSAEYIIIYFDPNTKSPVTLLELGLHVKSKKIIVCCPKGFWRKGNIDILCYRYDIPMFDTLSDMINYIKEKL